MPRHPHDDPHTSPMTPGREWDMPSGPHLGPPAALNVPISESAEPRDFDRGQYDEDHIIASEPDIDPMRHMEAGADWTESAARRVHELDRPIIPPHET